MIINRVVELSSLLSEAYKSKAELEVQLNVAKSNLQLVIANNEMLEEALKSGGDRDVGWRRAGGAGSISSAASTSRPASLDASHASHSPNPANTSPTPNESPTEGSSRFFKTFFNGSSAATTSSTLPGTPTQQQPQPHPQHLTSPSLPSLHWASSSSSHHSLEEEALSLALQKARADAERERRAADKARAHAVAAARDKIALEGEIESLSQALFEEGNKMGKPAKLRAEMEKLKPLAQELAKTRSALRDEKEELREAREEREALRSALRVIEGENVELRSASRLSMQSTESFEEDERGRSGMARSRSSLEVGTKSPVSGGVTADPAILVIGIVLKTRGGGRGEADNLRPAGLRAEPDDEDAHAQPPTLTPRRVVLAPLPVSDSSDAAGVPATHTTAEDPAHSESEVSEEEELEAELQEWADGASAHAHSVDAQWDRKSARSRTSSPGLSPPPTALAPAPADPWSAA
ncbi:hypothetical protein K438DRAFT_2059669 [Mycena galopus ATCC 62051]|nr:hypothetical protein K438DRAFT_2059669 [Mycena galopus ATCC 62051]